MSQTQSLNSLFFRNEQRSSERDEYRRIIVEISKLLVERWLGTERGKKFSDDVNNAPGGMKEALKNANITGISTLQAWINPEPAVGLYHGNLECDEGVDPNIGLALRWNIPFAERPTSVSQEVLENWIKKCEDWLNSSDPEDPSKPFPDPDDQFIPLATT
jgi:hypothetical protein